MKVSPKYKRFKHSYFTGDTFTLPDVRTSIIRNLQRCNQQQNTANLWRLKKQTQNREFWIQKTGRLYSVSVRALWSNLHPIIEMEEHFLVYYSYATKYHKLTSMLITGYQCSNVYIDVEKGALMNKDIQ